MWCRFNFNADRADLVYVTAAVGTTNNNLFAAIVPPPKLVLVCRVRVGGKMSRAWLRVAGLSGAAAVGLGAAGAHAIKPKAQADQEVFKTASTYHLAHTAPLALAATHFTGGRVFNSARCAF